MSNAENPYGSDLVEAADVGMLFDMKRFALHDGPGIRTTVFMKGCPLRCTWCHNPESQGAAPEIMLSAAQCTGCGTCIKACPQAAIRATQSATSTDRQRCIGCGQCAIVCPTSARTLVGYRKSIPDLVAQVKRDVVFFDESGGGVTLSGGEPLFQPSFAAAFLAQCQARRIHTALDTCGFAPWEDLKRVAQHADLILYDLKILSDSRHRRWTGHSNALILDNLTRLDALGKPVWIRIPFILEMHDDPDELSRLGAFIANLNCVEAVHLLPYHRTGEAKRQQLERSGTPKLDVPDERAVAAAGERLTRAAGQAVVIGG